MLAPLKAALGRRRSLLPVANVMAANLNMALSAAGAFAITPAVLGGLGDSAYGGWLLMNSVVSYMRLLDQGTSTGTMKLAAGAFARNADAEVSRIFNTSAAMFIVAGLLALLGSASLALVLPNLYAGIIGTDPAPVFILGLATAIDLLLRVFPSSLRAKSLFVLVDGIEIVTYSVFKLGLVLYLSQSLSYTVLSLLVLGESLARNGLVILVSRVCCPFIRHLRPLQADRVVFRRLIQIGAALSVMLVADVFRFQLDAGVIGYFMPSEPLAISVFGIGQRLPSIAFSAVGVIGAVMIPRFSGLSEVGEQSAIHKLLRTSSLVTGLASVYVLVNCAIFGPQFLVLWLKKPWVVESGEILLMMTPAYFIALLSGPAAGLLVAQGKLRGQMIITVIEALANVVLSVALVRPFGIVGVAIGSIVPMVVVRGFVFGIVVQKDLGIRLVDYFMLHARAIVIGIVYLGLVGGLAWVQYSSYQQFLLMGLVSTIVFLILVAAGVPEVRARLRRRKGMSVYPTPDQR